MLFFKYLFRCFRDLERDIKHLEGVISKDYGPEEEFASLSGQCFEYTDQEYTYKMCAFDYCSQRPNSQGKEVSYLIKLRRQNFLSFGMKPYIILIDLTLICRRRRDTTW